MTGGSSIPFGSIYPDGPAGGGAGNAVSAAEAQVNPLYPGMPAGATPFHQDVSLTASTTGTAIWTPPTDKRFVVASAFISSDTAGRVAICDGADVAGQRIVVQRVGANGGSSPNLVPVPYVSAVAGQAVVVASNITGNVDIRVSGWLQDL